MPRTRRPVAVLDPLEASRARYLEFIAGSGVLSATTHATGLAKSRLERYRASAFEYLRRVVRAKR